MRMNRRYFVAGLVVAALASTRPLARVVNAQTPEIGVARPELPALVVTPQDLGQAGMAAFPIDRVQGKLQTAQEVADEYVADHEVSANRATGVFVKIGLLERYWHRYVLRYPDDAAPAALAARYVDNAVFEFETEEAAVAAFDPLSRLLAWDAPAINAGIIPIGEQFRLSRAETPRSDGEGTNPELTITVRTGNIIVSITIADDKGEPDLSAIETLATLLLERVENISISGGPGLSYNVMRFPVTAPIRSDFDGYVLAGGNVYVGSAESTDASKRIEATAAAGAGALDGYQVSYLLVADDTVTMVETGSKVYRFYDESQAAGWIDVLPSHLEMSLVRGLKVESDQGAGDGSLVALYRDSEALGLTQQISAVQVGAMVAIMYGPRLSTETTIDSLNVMAACLDLDGCSNIFDQKSG